MTEASDIGSRRSTAGKVSLPARLRRCFFGLSPKEASFARRGFHAADEAARRHLEFIGETFLLGYHAALEERDSEALARRLTRVPGEFQGFAFEGAAMALALLDLLTPWRRDRWRSFHENFGRSHVYMMHVGLGWALARLRRPAAGRLARLDPLLGWLAVDGYGFHEGYFHWRRYVAQRRAAPARPDHYARRVFDQGLGRSIWFVKGADVAAVAGTLRAFEPARRPDLWSGVGLACAYAGGVGRDEMERLRAAAGAHRAELAQGAAFAAKTRLRAGTVNAGTAAACQVFCACSAEEAAAVTDAALEGLRAEGTLPAYEVWRRRIQTTFAREVVKV